MIVTGTHLALRHGATISEISSDGIADMERVEIVMDADSNMAVASSMALGVLRFTDSLQRLRPDILVILGDRFEAFAAASAATLCKIPIAHIHGGELSLGAIDDVFRHSITKMSHLHFASTEPYRRRIIQMGEHPERVFNVGALGVENALNINLLSRADVDERLGIEAGRPYVLMTYHPATLENDDAFTEQLHGLLAALFEIPGMITIATGSNADAGGRQINSILQETAIAAPKRFIFRQSLGQHLYLSALKYTDFVVGNSSSGIIEAPSFGIPTIDVGQRQSGRIRAESVIACAPNMIADAIKTAMSPQFRAKSTAIRNPYEKSGTSQSISDVLRDMPLRPLLTKGFFDLAINSAL